MNTDKTQINNLVKLSLEQLKQLVDMITKKPAPIPVLVRKSSVNIMKQKNDFIN